MKRNYFFMVAVLVLATSMVGCNMLRGAGKDVENAGKGVQRTVDHND
jgi:predicted small secreted protein